MTLSLFGAGCFGLVVGWICYRTLRRNQDKAKLSDLASVVGVIGGGAVTTSFNAPNVFASYSIGLAIGFFLYLLGGLVFDTQGTKGWMSGTNE